MLLCTSSGCTQHQGVVAGITPRWCNVHLGLTVAHVVFAGQVMWGQCIASKNKFATLVADSLASASGSAANLFMYAESGARIDNDRDKGLLTYLLTGDKGREKVAEHRTQATDRVIMYKMGSDLEQGKPKYPRSSVNQLLSPLPAGANVGKAAVDYVLINGCANDMKYVSWSLGTAGDAIKVISFLMTGESSSLDSELANKAVKHCYQGVTTALKVAAAEYPNAQKLVLGYYPILSQNIPPEQAKKAVDHVNTRYKTKLSKANLFPEVNSDSAGPSLVQVAQHTSKVASDNMIANQKRAVDDSGTGAIFVPSTFRDEHAMYGTDSMLFDLNQPETDCLDGEGRHTIHPNVAGQRKYRDAIMQKINAKQAVGQRRRRAFTDHEGKNKGALSLSPAHVAVGVVQDM